jgi:hypothetical protein
LTAVRVDTPDAQTPTRTLRRRRETWSGLKPSWPVRTTVNAQPESPATPSTLNVMRREISFAEMVTVPSVLRVLLASM